MKYLKIFLLVCCLCSIMSCNKYLEKEPAVLASIKTADQLEALINLATNFTYQTNLTAAYSSDDTDISMELYRNATAAIPLSAIYYYTFGINDISNLATDALWNTEYSKIFTANLVLFYADKVTGDSNMINQVKADAYFIRAYAYWELANYYCLPYSAANIDSEGLPLKTKTAYDESMKRTTLKQTYDQILSDVTEAQKLAKNDVKILLRWRASKPAIDAFLSRYYLFTGDYNQSLNYANAALASSTVKLYDFKTLTAGTPMVFANPAVTLNYSILNDYAASKFLYWDEFYFTRFVYNSNQWNIPSQALLSLYDTQNDLRFRYFMVPNTNRRFGILSPATYRYTVFSDGRYLPEGPTVAEVLLNKAEASARLGDFGGAMTTVNILRAKRMSTLVELTASSTPEAITKVLEERRRELPFSFRWLDIRRFAVNGYTADDVSISRTFFKINNGIVDLNATQTYMLPTNSSRYMVPINSSEIANSRGEIEQNMY